RLWPSGLPAWQDALGVGAPVTSHHLTPYKSLGRGGYRVLFAQQSSNCPVAFPVTPIAVAPGQPAIGSQDAATPDLSGVKTASPSAGIINALCDVTLSFVGCEFIPNSVTIGCDTNGDGIPDSIIPLININPVNAHLFMATLSTTKSGLPGSAFPLACCGGIEAVTLQLSVSAGDDNIFGPFTLTANCTIDVGQRAPVVISASPSSTDCSIPESVLISGSCFVLPSGVANVTSVFAVDQADPSNVRQAAEFVVLGSTEIQATFNFGTAEAGRTFLIFAGGPNGTSRNLTSLPAGAPSGCPLGNEQGVTVTVICQHTPVVIPPNLAVVTGCSVNKNASGKAVLLITGSNIERGAGVTIGGSVPKKVKFIDPDPATNTFHGVLVSGGICASLPGVIVITNPGQPGSSPFQCNKGCTQ
ncbi:MAG TPA: hypothetical protein VJX67_11615, partial [Blastocatellia bacterium]|nr:hypothetical protein [Blastocatellia bacterium]